MASAASEAVIATEKYPGIEHDSRLFSGFMQFAGSCSVLGSIAILTTGIAFPSMVKNKIYMQMILMISSANLFGAGSALFGIPENATACIIQGAMSQIGYRISWLWVVFLSFQLTSCMKHGVNLFTFKQMITITVVIIGCIEIVQAILDINYGLGAGGLGYYVCSYDTSASKSVDVIAAMFFLPMWLAVVLLLVNAFQLNMFVKRIKDSLAPEKQKMVLLLRDSCNSYPVVTIFTWGPIAFSIGVVGVIRGNKSYSEDPQTMARNYKIMNALIILASLEGFFNSIVFFKYGKEARKRWRKLLTQYTVGRWVLDGVFKIFGVGGTLQWHETKDLKQEEARRKKAEESGGCFSDDNNYDEFNEEAAAKTGHSVKYKSSNSKKEKQLSTDRCNSREADTSEANEVDEVGNIGTSFSGRQEGDTDTCNEDAFLGGERDFNTDAEILNVIHTGVQIYKSEKIKSQKIQSDKEQEKGHEFTL